MSKFKKVLAFLIILNTTFIFSNKTNAQVVLEWEKCYSGGGTDEGRDGFMTADGGYIFVGSSTSVGTPTSGCNGGGMISIIKTNSLGNLVWQKCLDLVYYTQDALHAVKLTNDGGLILTGMSHHKVFLLKTDSLGNFEWQTFYGTANFTNAILNSGSDVQQTNDNGYILTATVQSNGGGISGYHGLNDIWLAKVDSVGVIQWQFCYGGVNEDIGNDVEITNDGGYIVVGQSEYISGSIGQHGGFDLHMIKTDSLGTILWEKFYGGSGDEEGNEVKKTADGGYIIAGVAGSYDGQVTGIHFSVDWWVVKTDSFGNLMWQKCLGGFGGDRAYSVQIDSGNNYLIGGYAQTASNQYPILTLNPTECFGGKDFWVVKLDTTGSMIWQKSFGGTADETVNSIIPSTDDDFVLLGKTSSGDGDVSGNLLHNGGYTQDFWAVKVTSNFNTITGSLYFDSNNNNILDSIDSGLGYYKVTENTTGNFYFSNGSGNYKIYETDTGNYSVTPDPILYYNTVPAIQTANFTTVDETDSLNDFFIQSAGPVNDLCISISPMGAFRSGFNGSYMISYKNFGTTTISPTIIFVRDTNLTFVSSNVTPTTITTDTIYWVLGPLAPLQTGNIIVTTHVNVGLPIGTLLLSAAIIEPIAGDVNPACNTNYWEVYTTGSMDPNDVIVSRKTLNSNEFPNPPYLEYLVRFQNTGNDTAFFVNIRNNISPMLDINTFEIVATSHNASVEYDALPRLMTFKFDNILLVDKNTNEPESHGFIRYKIKPVDTLVVGNIIKNTASILFDYNNPIFTNTATTTIVSPLSLNEPNSKTSTLNIFPNPAKEEINILLDDLNGQAITVELYSAYGQKIKTLADETINGNEFIWKQNISSLSKGIYFIQIQSKQGTWMSRFVKM